MNINLLRECRQLLEDTSVEQQLRNLLLKIITAARHKFKSSSPEDLADELEALLQRANLSKPRLLSKEQYNVMAEVWSELGDNSPDVETIASRALMRLSA